MNCNICPNQNNCQLISLSFDYRKIFCERLRKVENKVKGPEDSASFKPIQYAEMLHLAFDTSIDNRTAQKAQNALKRAKKEVGKKCAKLTFLLPGKGKIQFHP